MKGPSRVPTQWATDYPVPVGWMKQFHYFIWLYRIISNVKGDVVECGIGEGNTLAMLAYLVGRERPEPQRKLWGFDSFAGWPEPTEYDASPRNPQAGEWKVNPEMVLRRFEASGLLVAYPGVWPHIVEGFFDQSLVLFPDDQQIAFLHIDADLYTGYHDALRYLFPKVAVGGVVAFDEYREFPDDPEYHDDEGNQIEKWPGCTRAVDDYFADRPEYPRYYGPTAKYFVVKER